MAIGDAIRAVWREIQATAPALEHGNDAFFNWTVALAERVEWGEVKAFDALQAMKWLCLDRASDREARLVASFTGNGGSVQAAAQAVGAETIARLSADIAPAPFCRCIQCGAESGQQCMPGCPASKNAGSLA